MLNRIDTFPVTTRVIAQPFAGGQLMALRIWAA